MSELSIPYARHYPSGFNRSSEEVQDGKGMKANVCCLGCEEMLVHRRTSHDGRRRAHYAHMSNSKANIQHCRESAIHALVKDIVADLSGTTLTLPDWHGIPITFTPIEGETEAVGVVENRIPDVILRNRIGQMLAVEIFFSNRKTPDAIADFERTRLATLELRVTLEDAYIEKQEIIRRLRGEPCPTSLIGERELLPSAKWLVYPVEPFDSECPPISSISNEYLRSNHSAKMMKRAGFRPIGVEDDDVEYRELAQNREWSIRKEGLTCWIGNYICHASCSCSSKECLNVPSYTFRVGTEKWYLTNDQLTFMLPCDALELSAKSFKAMQDLLLRRSKSTYRLTRWRDHYRKNEKGNWVSRTAVRGTTITAYKSWWLDGGSWGFCVASKTWIMWSQRGFDSPISARTQAEDLAVTFKALRIPPNPY